MKSTINMRRTRADHPGGPATRTGRTRADQPGGPSKRTRRTSQADHPSGPGGPTQGGADEPDRQADHPSDHHWADHPRRAGGAAGRTLPRADYDTDRDWHLRNMKYGEGWAYDSSRRYYKTANPPYLFCFCFVFFVGCFFVFFGGFKGQARWPEGPPHLALNPPYLFFLFVFCLFFLFLSFLCF